MKHITKLATFAAILVTVPTLAFAATLDRQLEVGSRGADVSALQTFLAQDATLYPQGLVTGYFGFLTKSAVSNFQSRNGISAVGRVGPQTLPVINAAMGGSPAASGNQVAPNIYNYAVSKTSSSITVSLSTDEQSRIKLYFSTQPITMTNTYEATGIANTEPTVSGSRAPYTDSYSTSHTVTAPNLNSNTTYYYQVVVIDTDNNVSISLPASIFTN